MTRKASLFGILVIALMISSLPFLSGCTYQDGCGGGYHGTRISSTGSMTLNINRTDTHYAGWTGANITTTFSITGGTTLSFTYHYASQSPGGSQYAVVLEYAPTGNFASSNEKFPVNTWLNFTIETRVTSSDPDVQAYKFYNGSSLLTGKLRIKESGNSGVTEIQLDRQGSGAYAGGRPGSSNNYVEINVHSQSWQVLVVSFSNYTIKC